MDIENNKNELSKKSEMEAEGAEVPKEKIKFLRYLMLLSGSMVVVFFTVWISVSRLESSRRTQNETGEGALSDSMAVETQPHIAVTEKDTVDSKTEEEKLQEERSKLIEEMTMIKDQLNQKQIQMREMSIAAEERENLANEIILLKTEIEQKEKELEYLRDTLPERVVDKLADKQALESNQSGVVPEIGQNPSSDRQFVTPNATAQSTDANNNAGIRKLAKIYEAMRPENAAPILARLDDDEIIEILLRMRQRSAAKILSNLDPEVAARISKRIGGK